MIFIFHKIGLLYLYRLQGLILELSNNISQFLNSQNSDGWNVIKKVLIFLITRSPQIFTYIAIFFISLAYERSNGVFWDFFNKFFVISLILYFLSLMLEHVIIKPESIDNLKKEIKKLKKQICDTELFYFQNAKEKALSEIRSKLKDEQPVDVVDYFHELLAIIAQVNRFTAEERITVFSFDSENEDQVIMLGRYSENRTFNGKGRGIHSTRQGSISKALKSPDRYSYKNNFPEEEEEYKKELKNNENMTDIDINSLRMKARTIGSFMLHNSQGHDQIAIMVLESLKKESPVLTEEKSRNIYNCFKKELANFVQEIIDLNVTPIGNANNELEY
ncbi:MAG: hypothetical protein PHE78_00285 [Candidatus Gastranaerophilales bacterium]|nr:hypothetical protein [Candidatus Gastranaerophilales bacterium]